MTIVISSEANAPLPGAGEVTLFINTDKNNILYAKYPDGSVLPYNGSSDANSAEIAKAWMDAINCALKGGNIDAEEYESLMNQGITVQADSTFDEDGGYHSTLSVGSRVIPLSDFDVDDETVTLTVAAPTHQIVPEFMPTYVSNKGVDYASSDPTKATVGSNGLLTRVANGTTYVSAIPQADPSKTKTIVVTVTD